MGQSDGRYSGAGDKALHQVFGVFVISRECVVVAEGSMLEVMSGIELVQILG